MATTSTSRRTAAATATPAVHCRVECADLHARLFAVTLTIAAPAAQQRVALPVWIPGSYLVREFAKNLQGLRATQGRRKPVLTQLDKCSWQIDCVPGQPLVLHYQVCAYDNSVRTAWLDATRGFFNGTSVCLRVEGQTEAPHALEIVPPALPADAARWSCATALVPTKADKHGFGSYRAAGYDELADSPVEMGAFWSAEFEACGVPHRFVIAGAAASFDGERLIADTKAICEAEIRFWHGDKAGKRGGPKLPIDRYVFMLNAVDDGYGGLEHRHSTALICNRRDLPLRGERRSSPRATPRCWASSATSTSTPGTSSACARRSSPATTTAARTTRSCCGSSKASRATTTTCCCAAPAASTTPRTCACSTRPSTRCCRRPAGWCSRWPTRASTPGSSTTARTSRRPTAPSATTPRVRWWRCASTSRCARKARARSTT